MMLTLGKKPMDHEKLLDIEQRLTRIESRLVQLMLHLKMDPYNPKYVAHKEDKVRQ